MASQLQLELIELLQVKLFTIGTQALDLLVGLSSIAEPTLPSGIVVSTLGRMFGELPSWLGGSIAADELLQICANPPHDAVHLRLLMAFYELSQLLATVTHEQLLHFHHYQPPGPLAQRLAFFSRLQQAFVRQQTRENVEQLRLVVQSTPEEVLPATLFAIDPLLQQRDLPLFVSLLHLSPAELSSLLTWFADIRLERLQQLVQLLELDLPILFELKTIFQTTQLVMPDTASANTTPTPTATSSTSHTTAGEQLLHQHLLQQQQQQQHQQMTPSLSLSGSGGLPATHGVLTESQIMNPLDVDIILSGIADVSDPLSAVHSSSTATSTTTTSTSTSTSSSSVLAPPLPSTPQHTPHTPVFSPATPGLSSSRSSSMDVSRPAPTAVNNSGSFGTIDDGTTYKLRIITQPPAQTVYQRIVRPNPKIMLEEGQDPHNNLWIETVLIRADSDVPIQGKVLDGPKMTRISTGHVAILSRLKILCTSQQQGTLFRLKFVLRRYDGTDFTDIAGAVVISNPIEVFSHTVYIRRPKHAPPPPILQGIFPDTGTANTATRMCAIGCNYVNTPALALRFGDQIVSATFHSTGTILCNTPPLPPGTYHVSASNDGTNFSEPSPQYVFVVR